MSEGSDKINSQRDAQAGAPKEPPRLGGVRFGPTLAGALYVLLVLSAALALWVRSGEGRPPVQVAQAAPWVFLAFVIVFALYRFGLVRARRYPAFKAFFQVGAALLFFMLLLPGNRMGFAPGVRGELPELLRDSNPDVRAVAAEVARYRGDKRVAPSLVDALSDPDARVRAEAHRSLVQLSGEDLGSPEDPEARRAWRERYP